MSFYPWAFLIGIVCGLRSMAGPVAVTWAAKLGWLHLDGTRVAFLGTPYAPYIASFPALLELVGDKLPKTPSRKATGPFLGRIFTGALSGGAIGAHAQSLWLGAILGAAGGVAGTLGGYEFRSRLVRATGGRDLPIALLEDVIAIGGAFLVVSRFVA